MGVHTGKIEIESLAGEHKDHCWCETAPSSKSSPCTWKISAACLSLEAYQECWFVSESPAFDEIHFYTAPCMQTAQNALCPE